MPGTFFQQISTQQADVAQPWNNSLEFYITPWGFLKGAAANNAAAAASGIDARIVLTFTKLLLPPSRRTVSTMLWVEVTILRRVGDAW